MRTINISLSDAMKAFVDSQVENGGYGTSSDYVRELIHRDQDRAHLRSLLLRGVSSPPGRTANRSYFAKLRQGIKNRARR